MATVYDLPIVVVVNPAQMPSVTDVQKLITHAKARPGQLNYTSSGAGSFGHLSMELLKQLGGFEMQHVPYKGGVPAITDTIGGQVPLMYADLVAALPHIQAGKLRAVVAAGLHPSIGLHHSNDGNAMRLVDDLLEPFRPIVDLKVWQLQRAGEVQVTPETKRALVRTLYDDMQSSVGATPVMVCMQKLAVSLAQVYLGERDKLDLPLPGLPLALAGSLDSD